MSTVHTVDSQKSLSAPHYRSALGFIFTFAFALLFTLNNPVIAQSADDISDFENMRVSELTDAQLEQISNRLEDEGLSLQEAEQMAIMQGMTSGDAAQLSNRIRQFRSEEATRSDDGFQLSDTTDYAPADKNSFMVFLEDEDEEMIEEAEIDWELLTQRQRVTTLDSLRRDKQSSQRIFGYQLFSQRSVSFAPSLSLPTPKNYQLGPGDEVVINIWGAAENLYQLTLANDGTITIPSLGPIHLNGYSIEDAEKRLIERLKTIYSGLGSVDNPNRNTYADVTVGKVRSINVSLVGEVKQPGTYTVPSMATVFNALYASGGPNANGTFRNIQIIRGNSIVETLDIYDFLVDGDQTNNIRLKDQDIIKIDPFENRVNFVGEVKRPGLYELREGETLADLLRYSGGFSDKAYRARVNVEQITDREHSVRDVFLEDFENFTMKNGDRVDVGKVLDRYTNRIEINGAVYRPGPYELKDGTTLFSLIEDADGLKEDVFMNRALIIREQDNRELETISVNLRRVMNDPARYDVSLQRNDVIRISSIFDLREEFNVMIAGAVREPDTFEFTEKMTLGDLVFQAGGFRESAAPYRIDVARRKAEDRQGGQSNQIAEIHEFSVNKDLSLDGEDAEFTLQPFDRVYVRHAPGYEEQQQVEISGEVMFPGTYTISRKNETISDLIERAGGLTGDAYLDGANILREQEYLNGDESGETDQITKHILSQELDTGEGGELIEITTQRVAVDFANLMRDPSSNDNLILREGDEINIPIERQTVSIRGGVLQPTNVRYQDGHNLHRYITQAGGFSERALENRAFVIYPNGEVDRTRKLLFFRNSPEIKPGSTIVVPIEAERERISRQERIAILSTIVSMTAVVATTIERIGR
ncbi:MAG: SLBB domain-containing protein [Balneolales bacterium]